MMKTHDLVVGPLQVNCYVVYDEKSSEAAIVDPGDDVIGILRLLEEKSLTPKLIVCTHGHFDHVGGVRALKAETDASIVLHGDDLGIYERAQEQAALWGFSVERPPSPDVIVAEGDRVRIGDFEMVVMHTPGHSPGSICLLHRDILFSGDTVFAGSIGRTDFSGGSLQAMKLSFRRIIDLPGETRLFPGHGPASTVAEERKTNFFVHEL